MSGSFLAVCVCVCVFGGGCVCVGKGCGDSVQCVGVWCVSVSFVLCVFAAYREKSH